MKAYKDADGQVWLFRPEDNHARLNISAARMAHARIAQGIFYGRAHHTLATRKRLDTHYRR